MGEIVVLPGSIVPGRRPARRRHQFRRFGNDQGRQDVANEVVSAHIRALMAPQSFDVASSDRHTVKPWFAGKLPFAPKVVDLSTQGFPLAGARIDVVGLEPSPRLFKREAPDQRDGNAESARPVHAAHPTCRTGLSGPKLERWERSLIGSCPTRRSKSSRPSSGCFSGSILSSPSDSQVLLYVTMPNRARTCPVISGNGVTPASCPFLPKASHFLSPSASCSSKRQKRSQSILRGLASISPLSLNRGADAEKSGHPPLGERAPTSDWAWSIQFVRGTLFAAVGAVGVVVARSPVGIADLASVVKFRPPAR